MTSNCRCLAKSAVTLGFVLLASHSPSRAEGVRPITLGSRIRVKTTEVVHHFYGERAGLSKWIVGDVMMLDEHTIRMALAGGDSTSIRRDSIARIERSLGMDTRKGVGTFIGLFMGAGLGVVVFFVLPGDEECSPSGDPFLTECVAEETASVVLRALGTVLFTIVGAVAGYQIGSLIEVEKWEVAWERRSRLSLHPSASPSQMAAGGPTLVINF